MEHNEVLEASINLCRQVIDKVSINLLVGLFTMRNFFTAMSTLTQCRDYWMYVFYDALVEFVKMYVHTVAILFHYTFET